MDVLYVVAGVAGSIIIPGVYIGIVASIAITVCKFFLKNK